MKILVLSFYYKPDLCAGSFRCTALVDQLKQKMKQTDEIEVMTSMPHRYSSFEAPAPQIEQDKGLTIRRIVLPSSEGSLRGQVRNFLYFAKRVNQLTRSTDYDVVFATSGRLMTAVLGAFVARRQNAALYLDIRDLFADAFGDVFTSQWAQLIKPVFSYLEKWAFRRADRINIVSKGFLPYMTKRYPLTPLSYFTNGIDNEFLSLIGADTQKSSSAIPLILYAGNMGEGQGLHRIIPSLAKRLEGVARFRLIGDGGKKAALAEAIKKEGCLNVVLLPPVNRTQLVDEYRAADYLFLHLNDYKAFRNVLPSKLFEYTATGKPILAGVAGFAAQFIHQEIENAAVFQPCNVVEAEAIFKTLKKDHYDRSIFVKKFARQKIMDAMAAEILLIKQQGM